MSPLTGMGYNLASDDWGKEIKEVNCHSWNFSNDICIFISIRSPFEQRNEALVTGNCSSLENNCTCNKQKE